MPASLSVMLTENIPRQTQTDTVTASQCHTISAKLFVGVLGWYWVFGASFTHRKIVTTTSGNAC